MKDGTIKASLMTENEKNSIKLDQITKRARKIRNFKISFLHGCHWFYSGWESLKLADSHLNMVKKQ